MALQMTVSQNQIPQTTVIRILQIILIQQIIITAVTRIQMTMEMAVIMVLMMEMVEAQINGNGGNGGGGNTDQDNNGGDMISIAEQYIGQSLDALEGACGSPQGSSYEDDPETGKTGFHYYSNFTVSTTVDENGNEIVAGIW